MAVVQRTLHGRLDGRLGRGGALLPPLFQSITLLLVLLALALLLQHGLVWGQRTVDDWRYGFPRSAEVVGYVGHGDERAMPTLIETLNMNGQMSVLVIPGGDVGQIQVLAGPYLMGADGPYAVAIPALDDVNGDDHVDLLVTVQGETVVYMNDAGSFRPITADERATLSEGWSDE